MRRSNIFGLLLSLLVVAMVIPSYAQSTETYGKEEVRTDGVLVKMKSGSVSASAATMSARLGGRRVLRSFQRTGWSKVEVPKGMSVAQAIQEYKKMSDVALVEPNYVYHATATPNDPRMSSLWGMTKIQAPTAWDTSTGSSSIVVAIIDTGAEYTHPDLSANIWTNPQEIAGNGVDDDGDGYADDIHGIDAANGDSDPMDDAGHGTHVAGTIGGIGNNGVGVAGINWNVKIMPLKFLRSDGNGSTTDAIECYEYAIMMKNRGVNIRVINNSWGGGGTSSALHSAIAAAGKAGIVSVCAAGNGGSDGVGDNNDASGFSPANDSDPSVISVAASTSSDTRASFSNYGPTTVDIAAPGQGIMSTYPGGSYASMSGTSMASPHVAGAAALLAAVNPSLTVAQIKAALLNTVDKSSAWSGLIVSGGRMNLAKAVQSVGGGTTTPPPPTTTTRQPDLLIRTNSSSAFSGDNTYTSVSVSQSVTAGSKAVYQLRLQNDGNTSDAFKVTAAAATSGWTVRYYNAASAGTDITSLVNGSGWNPGTLAAGGAVDFRVEVTPSTSIANGAQLQTAINAVSTGNTTKGDAVKAITTATVTSSAPTPVTYVTLRATPSSPQRVNTYISLAATATGGPAEYMFSQGYSSGYGWTWTTLRNFSTTSTLTWRPTRAGSYYIRVFARAVGSTKSYEAYRMIPYTVSP